MFNRLIFLGGLGGTEILLIAILVLLFFGGKKIPELMNGLGKGVKSFRDGLDGKTEREDGNDSTEKKAEK